MRLLPILNFIDENKDKFFGFSLGGVRLYFSTPAILRYQNRIISYSITYWTKTSEKIDENIRNNEERWKICRMSGIFLHENINFRLHYHARWQFPFLTIDSNLSLWEKKSRLIWVFLIKNFVKRIERDGENWNLSEHFFGLTCGNKIFFSINRFSCEGNLTDVTIHYVSKLVSVSRCDGK